MYCPIVNIFAVNTFYILNDSNSKSVLCSTVITAF